MKEGPEQCILGLGRFRVSFQTPSRVARVELKANTSVPFLVSTSYWLSIFSGSQRYSRVVAGGEFSQARTRWKDADVLVVDESVSSRRVSISRSRTSNLADIIPPGCLTVSMMPDTFLMLLSNVGKQARSIDLPFGGLQVSRTASSSRSRRSSDELNHLSSSLSSSSLSETSFK